MGKPLQLELLSEKNLHSTASSNLVAYCPSMDLVALGTTDQQVLIYRLNGQRVYGAAQKTSSLNVECIAWKPNGQLLAVAWNDGSVRLIGAESTKIVHQFSTGDATGITCMGWASNLTRKVSTLSDAQRKPGNWGDLLSSEPDTAEPLNLPRDLSQIDIETSLPKLSELASSGGSSEDVFSSRASLDALFRPFDPKDNNAVDIMVVGTKEGKIHLSIYNTFVIGCFNSPDGLGRPPASLVLHASHEKYSTHALLMKSAEDGGTLSLVTMDLRFVSASSNYLSLLASRSTALHDLLRYIHEVYHLMLSEWKSTQDLPGKFLRNINETLAETGSRDIVQSLYHSVATGHTFPAVREWLVDELSERGHKRWDKAVTTGLENLKRLIHENMMPALDRCGVILSRFAGIARFQGANETVGFTSQQISHITETVASLHLVSSKILMQTVDELDLFHSFSSWLRYEIDRLASNASTNDDAADKESSIDHSKVLSYLQTVMNTSPMAVYFDESSEEDYAQNWKLIEQGIPIFEILGDQLRKRDKGLQSNAPLSRVGLLCKFLGKQADAVFGQIAEAEKRNVLFGKCYEVGVIDRDGPVAMKMNPVSQTECRSYVALVPKGYPNTIQVVRVNISIENGISSIGDVDLALIQLGEGQVKDIKMLGNSLVVLWDLSEEIELLNIPYFDAEALGPATPASYQMKYNPRSQKASRPQPEEFSNSEVRAQFSKYKIPGEGFKPASVHIRQRIFQKGKADTGRIVTMGKDQLQYKVLKVPDRDQPDEDEDISMS